MINVNGIFGKNKTFHDLKTHKELWFHPLSRKYIFLKPRGGDTCVLQNYSEDLFRKTVSGDYFCIS